VLQIGGFSDIGRLEMRFSRIAAGYSRFDGGISRMESGFGRFEGGFSRLEFRKRQAEMEFGIKDEKST
jgi:hypothetical protein